MQQQCRNAAQQHCFPPQRYEGASWQDRAGLGGAGAAQTAHFHCDEPAVPPHELDEADPAVGGARLHLGSQQRFLRLLHRRLEAEGLVQLCGGGGGGSIRDHHVSTAVHPHPLPPSLHHSPHTTAAHHPHQQHVVVDGLGDRQHRALHRVPGAHLLDCRRSSDVALVSYDEKLVYRPPAGKRVTDRFGRRQLWRAAGGCQQRWLAGAVGSSGWRSALMCGGIGGHGLQVEALHHLQRVAAAVLAGSQHGATLQLDVLHQLRRSVERGVGAGRGRGRGSRRVRHMEVAAWRAA